jgi:exosome complex RNA-binding protein Csl4
MNANVIELNKRQHVNQRILKAKAAFTTRRVNLKAAVTLVRKDATPQAGDLVLARVDRIGQHQRIELVNGRRARMLVGDEIVVAYGNR